MRKIGFFNIGKLGLVKSAGTGKTDINKVIEKWIPKHMVFWYDMSKPVDTYSQNFNDWSSHPSVNADVIITSTSFVITRFATLNDTVKCYIPDQTKNFPGMKVEVKGIVDGQELYWGYSADVKLVNITSDGTYDIPPLETVNGNLSFRNGNIVGDCNITITQLPSGQSVPTNEILKANPYLQDFSGNNRPLKLNNFLFSAMSGVGGYTLNAKSYHIRSNSIVGTFDDYSIEITAKVTDILGIVWTKNGVGDSNSVAVGETLTRPAFTITVEGMPDDLKWGMYESGDADKGNGTFEIPAYTYTNNTETVQIKFIGLAFSKITFDNVDIKFTFQPLYPNALVTDGVDDYGQVQNLQQGVKMLFYTCNPFSLNKILYDQTKQGWRKFNIYNQADKIAYNERNENGVTYIDGNLNSLLLANDLVNKKQIITIVNEGSDANNTISPIYFSVNQHNGYFANLAFYNSIGFDSVPTKQNDGFTEQDLIYYYIPKAIVTITVVDVSGYPIQDATVTVEGVQYKTLSDGTVKVRGMVNGTMSLSVKKDGYMPFSDNSWKLADSRITLEVLRNTVITENGYSILLENDGLILTE